MKRVFLKLTLLGLMAIFGFKLFIGTALAENLNKLIVGNWNHVGSTATVEFFEDGTVIFLDSDEEFIGDYKFIDQNRIRIDLGGMGAVAGPQVTRIYIDKDKLILEKLFGENFELIKMTEARQIFLDGVKAHRKKEYEKAAEFYKKSAKLGDADAQNDLGFMYYKGEGVEKDYKQAFKWVHESAKQGIASSQRLLGYIYKTGNGADKNIDKAILWFQKAADQGDVYAQNGLAWTYATSENAEYRDGEKALKYAQMAYSQQPNNWYMNGSLAAAYARQGQFDMAVTTYKKAIDLLKRDKDLSQEEKQNKLDEAEILLSLYQNGQAYDESYDLDSAVAENKMMHKYAEEAQKIREEEARKKQKLDYERQQAEQKRKMEEEAEKRKKEEIRLTALKNECMTPSKNLYSFNFSYPHHEGRDFFHEVEGEIKNTEIYWKSRNLTKNREVGRINKRALPEPNWEKRSIWFGNIHKIEIRNNSSSYGASSSEIIWYLRINDLYSIGCRDKAEIELLYGELIAALSSWYDEFSDVAPQKTRPAFLSKTKNITEEIKPQFNKTLVFNIQKKLNALGYYKGEIDGISGQGTASAIKAYQNDNGLILDGIPTEELLAHLETKKTTYTEPRQTDETKNSDNPQTLENVVNKAVDGIFKSIFKTE